MHVYEESRQFIKFGYTNMASLTFLWLPHNSNSFKLTRLLAHEHSQRVCVGISFMCWATSVVKSCSKHNICSFLWDSWLSGRIKIFIFLVDWPSIYPSCGQNIFTFSRLTKKNFSFQKIGRAATLHVAKIYFLLADDQKVFSF